MGLLPFLKDHPTDEKSWENYPLYQRFREIINLITPQNLTTPIMPSNHQPLLAPIYSSQWEGNNKIKRKQKQQATSSPSPSALAICTSQALGTASDSHRIFLIIMSGCRWEIKVAYKSLSMKIEKDW